MATTADRLRQALSLRRMKQSELAERTKIGKSSISTYLSGAYLPKQRNIYRMAEVLNVNEAWLMGLDVPMERKDNPSVTSAFRALLNQLGYEIYVDDPEHRPMFLKGDIGGLVNWSEINAIQTATLALLKYQADNLVRKSHIAGLEKEIAEYTSLVQHLNDHNDTGNAEALQNATKVLEEKKLKLSNYKNAMLSFDD